MTVVSSYHGLSRLGAIVGGRGGATGRVGAAIGGGILVGACGPATGGPGRGGSGPCGMGTGRCGTCGAGRGGSAGECGAAAGAIDGRPTGRASGGPLCGCANGGGCGVRAAGCDIGVTGRGTPEWPAAGAAPAAPKHSEPSATTVSGCSRVVGATPSSVWIRWAASGMRLRAADQEDADQVLPGCSRAAAIGLCQAVRPCGPAAAG